jgi:hypothetical protein
MPTASDLSKMPKWMLAKLLDTAGAIGYDDVEALQKVRGELAALGDAPSPLRSAFLEEFKRLEAKIDQNRDWSLRLSEALRERRTGFQRVYADDPID